jgi:hypothetical protein
MSLRFSATTEGIRVRAADRELAVLRAVPGFLATVPQDAVDTSQRRIDRPVYPDDPAADREFRRLTASDAQEARTHDREIFETVIRRLDAGSADLSVGEGEALVRAIGSARIALAARSGLFELEELPPDPSTPQQMLIVFLGMVQEDLVAALTSTLPPPTDHPPANGTS